jgi:NAD+ synthase
VRLVARSYPGFPAQVVSQAPSANLWKGQTDETELGFSYEELDAYILSSGNLEIAEYLGISKATWTRIFERIDGTEFKRRDKPTWGASRRLGERLTLA